jgi:hypothetical protein
MKTVHVENFPTAARDLVAQAAREPILLHDANGRSFVLAEVDEADAEVLALSDHPQFLKIIERSRARAEREGWLTTEQLREQLGLQNPSNAS